MKTAVITTFNKAGLVQYAQRMIDTFSSNWPKEISLYLYAELCDPFVRDKDRTIVKRLEDVDNLNVFKNKWKNVPKANGDVSDDPIRSKRKDAGKGFKWDAVRFAHKVYAIFDCAKNTDADILIWMDADTVCHSPISLADITKLIPKNSELCYLGRKGKYSECGLYSMNLQSTTVRNFLNEFQRMYDQAEDGIFLLDEWHDSFVFDAVRAKYPLMKQHDWAASLDDLRSSPGVSKGEGHPLINCEWGAYLDHLKGDRKIAGRSKEKDLKVIRNESYWKS